MSRSTKSGARSTTFGPETFSSPSSLISHTGISAQNFWTKSSTQTSLTSSTSALGAASEVAVSIGGSPTRRKLAAERPSLSAIAQDLDSFPQRTAERRADQLCVVLKTILSKKDHVDVWYGVCTNSNGIEEGLESVVVKFSKSDAGADALRHEASVYRHLSSYPTPLSPTVDIPKFFGLYGADAEEDSDYQRSLLLVISFESGQKAWRLNPVEQYVGGSSDTLRKPNDS